MTETRVLMMTSAVAMAVAGVATSFLPQELLSAVGAEPGAAAVLVTQMAGALYVGFAAVNWTARGVLIGGIYARPLAVGNFFHFAIGAVTLIKLALATPAPALIGLTAPYVLFALWFGRVLFRPPSR